MSNDDRTTTSEYRYYGAASGSETGIVEARQVLRDDRDDVAAWCGGEVDVHLSTDRFLLYVTVKDVRVPAREGEWIVKDHQGWFICGDDDFAGAFEKVSGTSKRVPDEQESINDEFFEVYGADAARRAYVATGKAARVERGSRGDRR